MLYVLHILLFFFFFFNDTATTEIYTLSLHDALPISSWRGYTILPQLVSARQLQAVVRPRVAAPALSRSGLEKDRKSTRLNSSHGYISYAVFCLKKKKNKGSALIQMRSTIHTRSETSV